MSGRPMILLKYLLPTLKMLKYLETKGFFQFELIIKVLVSPFRLIWICYWSTASMSILILLVRGPSL